MEAEKIVYKNGKIISVIVWYKQHVNKLPDDREWGRSINNKEPITYFVNQYINFINKFKVIIYEQRKYMINIENNRNYRNTNNNYQKENLMDHP